jgi:hypothetical protein
LFPIEGLDYLFHIIVEHFHPLVYSI